MTRVSPDFLRKYEQLLAKDPDSQAFAPLAEAYLKLGEVDKARSLSEHGVKTHPDFAGGHLVLGQILTHRNEHRRAIEHLEKAVQLSPENIRAHTRLGKLHLKLRNGKEALAAYKMVLLLNPNDKAAIKTVEKLESLSAKDFSDDLFAIQPLSTETLNFPEQGIDFDESSSLTRPSSEKRDLNRSLSLFDAFLARSEIEQAVSVLEQLKRKYPQDKQVKLRENRASKYQEQFVDETPEPITPIPRDQLLRENKHARLEKLLQKVTDWQKELEVNEEPGFS